MVLRSSATRSVVAFGAAFAIALTLLAAFTAHPASAQTADACAISRFTAPDGTVDVTSYLQCISPTVSEENVVPGGAITFAGGGFAGGSQFDVFFESDPVFLGTFTAAADGNFSVAVTIPADAPPGEHRLVAVGVDPDGNPLRVEKVIQVVAPGSATASTPSGALPYTGSNTLQLVGVGVALVLVGGAVVVGIRRRDLHDAA